MLSGALGLALWLILFSASAAQAGTIEGSVTNGTTGKAAGGVDVILIQLQGEMQPVATKADASGHFKFDRPEIGQGPMLLRVVYKGINYNEMAPPGRPTAEVKIYDSTDKPSTVSISTHAIVLRPNGDQLLVGEEYGVENQTQPPVSFFKADGTFQFNLPSNGVSAFAQDRGDVRRERLSRAPAWWPPAVSRIPARRPATANLANQPGRAN